MSQLDSPVEPQRPISAHHLIGVENAPRLAGMIGHHHPGQDSALCGPVALVIAERSIVRHQAVHCENSAACQSKNRINEFLHVDPRSAFSAEGNLRGTRKLSKRSRDLRACLGCQ